MISEERAAEVELWHQRCDRELREGIEATVNLPTSMEDNYSHYVLKNKLKDDRKTWEEGEAVQILGRVRHEG